MGRSSFHNTKLNINYNVYKNKLSIKKDSLIHN
nr:MAG TPA: hypothetical protein [Caudoviricetes sp.]